MIYAARDHQTRTAAGVAAELVGLEQVSREAERAGDLELALAIEGHIDTVRRCPALGVGAITLHLRSGRQVPLAQVRSHIRRSAKSGGRSATAGKSNLTRQMERLSAECRALTGECQRESIAQTLRFNGRLRSKPAAPEMICFMCGEDELDGCFCE